AGRQVERVELSRLARDVDLAVRKAVHARSGDRRTGTDVLLRAKRGLKTPCLRTRARVDCDNAVVGIADTEHDERSPRRVDCVAWRRPDAASGIVEPFELPFEAAINGGILIDRMHRPNVATVSS